MFVAKLPGSTYATAAMKAGPRNGQYFRIPRRSPASDSSAASSTRASPGRTSSRGWTRAVRSWPSRGVEPDARDGSVRSRSGGRRSGHDPVDLEALRVLPVHVHAVHPCEVPDVLGIGVPAMLLRGVARQGGDLSLEVALLERHEGAVREVEVVPRDLVAENRRPLERAEALLCDRLVVLVDVVMRRLEHDVRLPVLPQLHEQLEDVLASLG